MTCRQFSELTGYKVSYVSILCKQGKIATNGKFEGSNRWDILPSEVPIWKAKKYSNYCSHRTTENDVGEYMRKLNKYNQLHGTNYSYGVSVSLGLIK